MANGESCVVCARPESDLAALQVCANCGGAFHLNPRQGPGVDCGIVGLGDEQNPALLFVCNTCLHMNGSAAVDPPAVVSPGAPPDPSRFRRIHGAPRAG